jgi:hypothetical protein
MMAGMMMYAVVMNGIAEVHKVRFQRCGHLLYRSNLSMSRSWERRHPCLLVYGKTLIARKSRQGCLRSQGEFQFGAVTGRLGE